MRRGEAGSRTEDTGEPSSTTPSTISPVPTAAFTTLGCKVNQYETQRILESFDAAGFGIVPFDSVADVYVVNTCSVTSIAEGKSRYTLRKAAKTNPLAKIVATGCAAQMGINRAEPLEGADVVVENPAKLETFQRFALAFPEVVDRARREPAPKVGAGLIGRTRATLKVQDGCSVMCSYCSIPFTRPGMTSRPASDVLDEARRMAEMGYREVVLTGVLIGSYGLETGSGGPDFEDLVGLLQDALADFAPMRLRVSSIETTQVTPRLVDRLLEPHPVSVAPHLHIPLQAGDDQVLADMNRPYRRDDYLRLCEGLYQSVPDLSITTDIMVGFPTEGELEFENTLDVCRKVGFLKVHAFRFSPRFGTPADRFGDPVSAGNKQDRAKALGSLSVDTGAAHARRFVGRTLRVLVEGKPSPEGLLEGLSDNYLSIQFAGPPSLSRSFAWVRIESERGGKLYGELAPEPSSTLTSLPVTA